MQQFECLLCGYHASTGAKTIPSEPLAKYWSDIGYDVKSAHARPEKFTASRCGRCGLSTFEPTAIGGPDLYAALGRQSFYYGADKWDQREAAQFLMKTDVKSLVEFGCGKGRSTSGWARALQSCD